MDIDTRGRLWGLICDWVLPIIVVFSLEVVGYVLYTRYRGRHTHEVAAGEHAPSKQQEELKADSWPRSLRLRSECSTDLNSDAEYLASRQGSGELGCMGQDVLTHRSCSIPSRVAGLALDGVVLRRSTAPPTAKRQGLPPLHSDCSPPRSYCPGVAHEVGKSDHTYTPRDLLDVLCCMRREGLFDGKRDVPGGSHSTTPNTLGALTQALVAPAADSADAVSPFAERRASQRNQGSQLLQNRSSAALWDPAAMQSGAEVSGPSAAGCMQSNCVSSPSTDLEKREEAANTEARPLLYKALKFRQFDIASTIYLGFKHECMTIRPETFVLLIQVALSSKAFATCAEWLVELMSQSDVDAEWLDRVVAALSVGAPLVLKALLDQLEELRRSDRLSTACSAVVAHASSYLALASSPAGLGVPAESAFKTEMSSLPLTGTPAPVARPPGLSCRPGKLLPNPTKPLQAEQRAVLKPSAESPPSSKGLNPNAPEFVPVGPALSEHAPDDLQQTVLAHQQLQQNILMLLQQKGSGEVPNSVTENNTAPPKQEEVPSTQAGGNSLPTKELEVMAQIQQLEEAKGTERGAMEPADKEGATEGRSATAEDAKPEEPAEAPAAVEQQQHPEKQQEEVGREQQGVKAQLTLQQQLQQHLERALLQHGVPPGLPPPRRHLKNIRQTESPGTVQSESCRSPAHSKDDAVASRQRIADALISRIASRSKSST